MTWKDGRKIIDARREAVARLHLRGLTQREIEAALPKQGFVNAETGNPFDLATVNRDLKELRKQWRDNAQADIAQHKTQQLAELAEVKRAAWASKHLDTVLRAMQQEAKIMGIEAPVKATITGQVTQTHEFADDAVADLLGILADLGALQPGAEEGGDPETQ